MTHHNCTVVKTVYIVINFQPISWICQLSGQHNDSHLNMLNSGVKEYVS